MIVIAEARDRQGTPRPAGGHAHQRRSLSGAATRPAEGSLSCCPEVTSVAGKCDTPARPPTPRPSHRLAHCQREAGVRRPAAATLRGRPKWACGWSGAPGSSTRAVGTTAAWRTSHAPRRVGLVARLSLCSLDARAMRQLTPRSISCAVSALPRRVDRSVGSTSRFGRDCWPQGQPVHTLLPTSCDYEEERAVGCVGIVRSWGRRRRALGSGCLARRSPSCQVPATTLRTRRGFDYDRAILR
jgi:hypothetical protein